MMTADFYTDMGLRISQLRNLRNITQEKLAEELDVSVKHVGEIERGITGISLEKLVELSRVLDAGLDFIVFGKETAPEGEIPLAVMEILKESDEKEKKVFLDYILMFKKLRRS
ncbi:MAG: helix-turn-helix transcriptional regulator [Lachnospiraceae bacterium]|nr:helix-turn-helix transcriptional regulator [Lachnospiraceae bacterium]